MDERELFMRPSFPEAYEELAANLKAAGPETVWRLQGVFEPLSTGFQALLALHDFWPGFSYATAADEPRPCTWLWPARAAAVFG